MSLPGPALVLTRNGNGRMSLITRMLVQVGLVERRKDGRTPVPSLELVYGEGTERKGLNIRDISPTGVFVLTEDRLKPGTHTLITLGQKPEMGRYSCPPVRLWARAVRQEEQGVGLTFVRDEADKSQWLELMSLAADMVTPGDAVARFRVARALSFLAQISPSVEIEIAEMMAANLDRRRKENLLALVFAAEQRLEEWNQQLRRDVSPLLIRQILQEGSKAEDEPARGVWVQLLATSCVAGTDDVESLYFADVLSKLLPIDLAIFSAACERTLGVVRSASMELYCSAEELREIAHTPNLVAIEQHLHFLHDVDLIGKTAKPLKGEQIRQANMTATALGLQLYARCFEPSERMSLAACG